MKLNFDAFIPVRSQLVNNNINIGDQWLSKLVLLQNTTTVYSHCTSIEIEFLIDENVTVFRSNFKTIALNWVEDRDSNMVWQ